jgi:hypothetical protein
MSNYDTFGDLRQDVLDRAGESPTDATGDYYAAAGRMLARAGQELANAHPWLALQHDPPLAFRTVAPVAITVTVTLDSDAISAISPAPGGGVSYQGRKIKFAGIPGYWRIKAHAAGATTATLDTAYDGPSASGLAATIYQDEYDLAPSLPAGIGLRHLLGVWAPDPAAELLGRSEAFCRREYPDPVPQWPPSYYARIGETRLWLVGYPDRARRIEVPYTRIPVDITADADGSGIWVPRNFRYVLADGGLYWLFDMKNDSRAEKQAVIYGAGRERMLDDDSRKRLLYSPANPEPGPYA